jgi:Mn-dependent DtxR family transcriptional regulator
MNTQGKYHQSEQDYLETILEITKEEKIVHRIDIAKRLNVSQAAVNKAVKNLCEKGYLYEDGKHLYLTKNGTSYAEAVFEKHCIIREFLIQNGVSALTAEQDACKLEHVISEETFEMMKKYIER